MLHVRNLFYSFSLLVFAQASIAEQHPYVRLGISKAWSKDTTFEDKDSRSIEPPALFGSSSTTAKGDFGHSMNFEVALGYRFSPNFRGELLLSHVPGLEFSGTARFFNAGDSQPVSADMTLLNAMLAGYVEFPAVSIFKTDPSRHGLIPFLGLGIGQSRNSIDRVIYRFPAFDSGPNGENAVSITPNGNSTETSYQFIVGVSYPMKSGSSLELSYRYSNYGKVKTSVGPLRVVRYNNDATVAVDRDIIINETHADLETNEVSISYRKTF